jgi:hypothetical protein
MGSFVQTITVRVKDNHEEALAAAKRYKEFMEKKGAKVSAVWNIEAGAASGVATIVTAFPNAAAWARLVDDSSVELTELRKRAVKAESVIATSLLQEIDL